MTTQYRPARILRPAPGGPRRAGLAGYRRRPRLGESAAQIVGVTGTLATSAASAAGMAAKAASSTTGILASLGSAAPFIGIGVEVATLLAQFVGKGCGSACVDASKAEQIYEAGTDNIWAVAKAGMISRAQFVTGAQAFLQASQQHLAQFGTKQAQKGAQNAANVIGAMINGASAAPAAATVPLDLNAAQSLYLSGAGWYPDSLAAAAQLANSYLQSLPPTSAAAQSASTGAATTDGGAAIIPAVSGMLSGTIYGIPIWMLAAGAAAFLLFR